LEEAIMVEVYSREQLLKKYGEISWISPYQRIFALVDEHTGTVELHEFHARGKCSGGAAWEVYHYPRVSSLVISARREGARNIFKVKQDRCELELVPGIAGAGIESLEVSGGEVKVTYAGLAGGGVAATICRGMAEGVKRVEVYERGGGSRLGRATLVLPALRKIVIGLDDTDEPGAGATWSMANELGYKLENEGLASYIGHTIVQLYTKNPNKTTNCVSIATTFAVEPSKAEQLVELFQRNVKEKTFSENTGMAVFRGIMVPKVLSEYSRRAKMMLVKLEEAKKVAEETGVQLISITGERGLIGALAAVGFADQPDEAVKVYA
jgi:methanogenesis imperfect marker protein 11